MGTPLDSPKTIFIHQAAIQQKPFLKRVYEDFYNEFKKIRTPKGLPVELGSGAGFLKELIPNVLTSDIVKGRGIDKIFSATEIPFKKETIAAFFMFDVFHHIKNPEKALREMERCLKPKGKILMIEPYNSLWGRFIYQNFHHENFEPNSGWKIKGTGRLSDANGALPWIIFVRDRKIFERKFPGLKIVKVIPHTPFCYLLSGGMSKPQFIPELFYPIVKFIENILSPFNSIIGMFVTIELRKT